MLPSYPDHHHHLLHHRDDIGAFQELQASHDDRLGYLANEMCRINTRVGHIASGQSRLSDFIPSPKCDSSNAPFAIGDDDSASTSASDDKMTTSK